MSAVLEAALRDVHPECFRACVENDRTMRLYRVAIGPRECPRICLEVYAADSLDAALRHLCLAENERMEVTAL